MLMPTGVYPRAKPFRLLHDVLLLQHMGALDHAWSVLLNLPVLRREFVAVQSASHQYSTMQSAMFCPVTSMCVTHAWLSTATVFGLLAITELQGTARYMALLQVGDCATGYTFWFFCGGRLC